MTSYFTLTDCYGLGGGFTKPSPFTHPVSAFQDLISVTATDKYTVVFKWKTPNPEFIMETLHGVSASGSVWRTLKQ